MKIWCVRYRNGWCVLTFERALPETGIAIRTLCKHDAPLKGRWLYREPTCERCKEALETKR